MTINFAFIQIRYLTIIRSIIVLSTLFAIASCGGGNNLLNEKPQSEAPIKPEDNPINLPIDDREDERDPDRDKNEDLPIISTEEEKPLVRPKPPRPKPPTVNPLNQGENEQDDADDKDVNNEEVEPVEEEVEDLTEPLLLRDGVYRSDKIANLNYDEVWHMPVYHDNRRILIGIDLQIDPEETTQSWLSTRSERQNAVLHYGSRKDNK